VYDKTVRRRRAVLGLLIACSLILLTAYFGESGNGSLHAVQRGVMGVVAPIEDIASRAVSPVRNLFNWVGDTFNAKGDVKSLRQRNKVLLAENIRLNREVHQFKQLTGIRNVDTNSGLQGTKPVSASVINSSPNVWNKTITIDHGSGDGIRVNQPVIGADDNTAGLIGRVMNVGSGFAVVTLITNDKSFVSAQDIESGVRSGVAPAVGNPGVLEWYSPRRNDHFKVGDTIVTSGTCSSDLSLFPPDIPIGTVTSVDNPGTSDQTIRVKPIVNLGRVENVQVLTRTVDDNRSEACRL
jgi:rod shape-determining protein MreC